MKKYLWPLLVLVATFSIPIILMIHQLFIPETVMIIFGLMVYIIGAAIIIGLAITGTVLLEAKLERNPKWHAAMAERDQRWKIICELEQLWAQGVRDFNGRCFFCGADNQNGAVGYAGERCCNTCGQGGYGEFSAAVMANEEWHKRFG